MNSPGLTPQQTALRNLALRQLEAAQMTLHRLQSVTKYQGDREAVQDAVNDVRHSQVLLNEWLGTVPEDCRDM